MAAVCIMVSPPAGAGEALELDYAFSGRGLHFMAGFGYDSYRWYVDGERFAGTQGGMLDLDPGDYEAGIHELMLVVTSGGVAHTANCEFTLGKAR